MHWYRKSYLVGVVIGVAALMAACGTNAATGASVSPQNGDEGRVNVITVSGNGVAYGAPDIATVELGVQARNADLGVATEEVNTAIDEVKAALLEVGVAEEDIQTANYSVWPEEDFDPETGQVTDSRTFRVQNTLRVKVRDTALISDVIGTALDNGANQVYGLYFSMEDSTALENDARTAAVADARAKAEALAEALGVNVGQVVEIREGSGGGVAPRYYEESAAMDMAVGGSGPSISEGQLSINVSVTVSYAIDY